MRRCEGTETEKEVRTDMNKGRIVQVMGPVVDVLFEDGELPNIKDALEVDNGDKTCIMEVAQHLGNSEVRCLMLAASEGLHKDMEVRATGSGIKVPVGDQTLGRLFNVLGQTIDDGKEIEKDAEDAPRQCRLRRARLQWPRSLIVPCWCSPSALKSELLYHEATKKERDKKPPSSFPPEGGSIVQNSAEFTARSCRS